jgi:AraC-like DNA-binding protein
MIGGWFAKRKLMTSKSTKRFHNVPVPPNEDVEIDRRVQATIEIMKASSRRGISVGDLARMVRLSRCHFAHLFKGETSKSPLQYLKQVRMEQAEEMLRETSLSLKEVVFAIGLSDRSHFSREFKKLYGLTPKTFIAERRVYCKECRPTAGNTFSR